LGGVEYFVGWRLILYPWRFVSNWWSLSIATTLIGFTYLIRALRLHRYFRLRGGLLLSLRLILQHTLYVNVLPMRSGEVSFPILMHRYFSLPATRTIPALLWLRLLDLHALVLIIVFVGGLLVSVTGAAVLSVLWMGALFSLYFSARRLDIVLSERSSRGALLLRDTLSATQGAIGEFLETLLLTIANWVLKLVIFGWIVQLFARTSYIAGLAGAVGGEVSSMLPIHGFAGLGTYEAGAVISMGVFGISVDDALTGAANLHLVLLGVSVVGGCLSLIIPLRQRSLELATSK
jgi:uncharacterized membrane protein YbhN (UPF0104 family)